MMRAYRELVLIAGLCAGASVGSAQTINIVTSVTGYIFVDSSRIFYEECGNGPTVVLVHDGVMGAATWDRVWDDLCAKFHVIRYDRRGMGRSSAAKVSFSQVEDLATLLTARHIQAGTLVGSSSGSAIAVDFALDHPQQVERLILLGPILHGMPLSDHFIKRDLTNLAPVQKGNAHAAAENQANDRYMLAPTHASARRKVIETLTTNPQNLQNDVSRGKLEERSAVPAASRLGELRVPTLILVGEYDIADVQAHAGALEFGIPGARREIISDAGHLIQLDQPALLRDRIASFVAESRVFATSAQTLQAVARTFALAPGVNIEFVEREGRLVAHYSHEREIFFFASSDTTFFALAPRMIQATFRHDSSGSVTAADLTFGGETHRASVASKH